MSMKGVVVFMGCFFLEIDRTLHFSGWKLVFQRCSHSANLFKSSCKLILSISDVIVRYTIVSSANSLVFYLLFSGFFICCFPAIFASQVSDSLSHLREPSVRFALSSRWERTNRTLGSRRCFPACHWCNTRTNSALKPILAEHRILLVWNLMFLLLPLLLDFGHQGSFESIYWSFLLSRSDVICELVSYGTLCQRLYWNP